MSFRRVVIPPTLAAAAAGAPITTKSTTLALARSQLAPHNPTTSTTNISRVSRFLTTDARSATVTAAPKAGQGPLLERRADRALPDLRAPLRTFYLTLPLFLLTLGLSTLTIFNYQKTHSSVITSTLYALRTNPLAREILGDEIQFKSKIIPWIRGELDQFHGRINIEYDVRGTKESGVMRFKSVRKSRLGLFETEQWDLVVFDAGKGGEKVVSLLGEEGAEPFPKEAQEAGV